MFTRTSVKLQKSLYERATAAAAHAGYSSIDEFIEHAIEKELRRIEASDTEAAVKQLKGLGYLE